MPELTAAGQRLIDAMGFRGDSETLRAIAMVMEIEEEARAEERSSYDPLDEWLAALSFVNRAEKEELFLSRGGYHWYANIRHKDGWVVWYMPGRTPREALSELVRALTLRGEPTYEVKGDFRTGMPLAFGIPEEANVEG